MYNVGLCQFQPKGCAADVKPILLGKCLIYAMFIYCIDRTLHMVLLWVSIG